MEWNVDLHAETALVTGGTRNIGLAIAEALRAAGARVCVIGASDQNALDEAVHRLAANGSEAMGMLAQVADEAAVIDAFDRVESELGKVSILINGAARRIHQSFTSITRQQWSQVVDVILTGAFLTSREMFRRLPADRRGAIVNIGGLSAHRPARERAHVIAAKSGLVGLTRALAEEGLGRIRANCPRSGRDRDDARTRPDGTSLCRRREGPPAGHSSGCGAGRAPSSGSAGHLRYRPNLARERWPVHDLSRGDSLQIELFWWRGDKRGALGDGDRREL